jgi:uncharacterized protein Yka (UPF0111/DUF47 family)
MNTNLFDNAFPFTGLFRRQADALAEAIKELASILHDFTAVSEKCGHISILVSEGEAISRQIERELSLTFIQPLNREDIHELNRAFQRAFQAVGAVSSRLGLYGFREVQKGAAAQAACLAEMVAEIAPLLEVIVHKGDGAANRERVRKSKREADTFLLVGLGEIYESAAGGVENLLEALKWSQIYDRLEEAASCLEHTVNVIKGIILKKV